MSSCGYWRYLFSPPANTKHFLEDAFAHLADVAKRFARQLKLTKTLATFFLLNNTHTHARSNNVRRSQTLLTIELRWLKFFYLTCVPSQRELGWPRLEPEPDDFVKAMRESTCTGLLEKGQANASSKIFTVPSSAKLPKALKFTCSGLSKVNRSASTAANQRAAAATGWLVYNWQNGFIHGPMAWTGPAPACESVSASNFLQARYY